jgi:hypothetical protein
MNSVLGVPSGMLIHKPGSGVKETAMMEELAVKEKSHHHGQGARRESFILMLLTAR